MPGLRHLENMRFGRLLVIERSEIKNKEGKRLWKCLCDCQADKPESERVYKYVTTGNLTNGKTQSCGCLHKEKAKLNGKRNRYFNKYDMTSEEYGIGWTRKGIFFFFDKEDYDLIKNYSWHEHQDGYLRTCYETINRKNHYIMMHQLIAQKYNFKFEPDHINGKPYDNRKGNLRDALHKDNSKNTKLYSSNTSGHKGVLWNKREAKWKAYIQCDKKRYNLGSFTNYEDAVGAREKAEEKYFGEYNRDKEFL